MNDDSRIQRYLSDRADAISLEPADATAVIKRGNRRRNQKRGGVLAAVAVLGVLGTSLVVQDPDADQAVDSELASSVVPSNLDWTVVQPDVALGYGFHTTALSDGSLYALSTAPGPARSQQDHSQHLYRSSDGLEWSEVNLPNGVKTSSLAAGGETLYAVGTAPAGGTARKVSVSASSDGGESWATVALPEDLADLDRRHPGQLSLSTPSVAALDDAHQVATFTVAADIDPTRYRDDIPADAGWEVTSTGVTIYKPIECAATPSTMPADAPVLDDAEADAARAAEADAARATRPDGGCEADEAPEVLTTYDWDELGVPAEIQEYVGGQTFTYATDDGASFERVDAAVDTSGWSMAQVLSVTDGYRLLVSDTTPTSSSTTVLSSTDGFTWTRSAVIDGGVNSAGLLGGRAAVSTWSSDGTNAVKVEQSAGSWSTLDVGSAVTPPAGHDAWVGEVAFGPLGLAATVTVIPRGGDGPAHGYLVHSADGANLSVLDLADHLDGTAGYSSGITVTADAITLRAVHDPDGDPATVEPMDVLIGTPR